MNEKFNKNSKVEQLTKVVLSHGEEKGLILKDPFANLPFFWRGYRCMKRDKTESIASILMKF